MPGPTGYVKKRSPRKTLAKRQAWWKENIKGGTGANGMDYHKPGSSKK